MLTSLPSTFPFNLPFNSPFSLLLQELLLNPRFGSHRPALSSLPQSLSTPSDLSHFLITNILSAQSKPPALSPPVVPLASLVLASA